jgi:hypothetical protein
MNCHKRLFHGERRRSARRDEQHPSQAISQLSRHAMRCCAKCCRIFGSGLFPVRKESFLKARRRMNEELRQEGGLRVRLVDREWRLSLQSKGLPGPRGHTATTFFLFSCATALTLAQTPNSLYLVCDRVLSRGVGYSRIHRRFLFCWDRISSVKMLPLFEQVRIHGSRWCHPRTEQRQDKDAAVTSQMGYGRGTCFTVKPKPTRDQRRDGNRARRL